MKRRTFIRSSAVAAAGVSLLNTGFISRRAAISRDIGIQLYTMAKPLSDDFTGTIKKLAAFGYKNLEFAGPYYFSPEEEIKNNPLVAVMGLSGYGYHGHTPKEIRMMLDDLGLVIPELGLQRLLECGLRLRKRHPVLRPPRSRQARLDRRHVERDDLAEVRVGCVCVDEHSLGAGVGLDDRQQAGGRQRRCLVGLGPGDLGGGHADPHRSKGPSGRRGNARERS